VGGLVSREQVLYYYLSSAPHGSDYEWARVGVPVPGLEDAKAMKIGTVAVQLEFLWVLFRIILREVVVSYNPYSHSRHEAGHFAWEFPS